MKLALTVIVIALLSACGDNAAMMHEVVCGDGIVEGAEACDDGNAVDADECNNACMVPGCGDGIINFAEACDDANDVDGDGCDSNCTQSFCGNGIVAGDEQCDDKNTVSGDGCDSNCKVTGCGNGAVSVGETCDDGNTVEGDGCDSNCTETACGNDIVAGTEQCDDGNTTSADGCSATCATETLEVEPNDDGTPNTNASGITGNDFATAAPDANGAITDSTTIVAALTPLGDEDIFKLQNTGTVTMRVKLDTWNLATGFGIGVTCGTSTASIDTGLQVRNAAGTVLASNDDRVSTDNCAALTIGLFPGEVAYVQVVENGDNKVVPSYALDIVFTPVVCGDGDVGPGELCDDMNTMAGDGCSATCQIEGALNEIEPNEDGSPSTGGSGTVGNDFGSAHPSSNGSIANDVTLLGSLSPLGDEDIYAFTNLRANAVTVTFDVWSAGIGFGIGVPCGTTVDTGLHVRDAGGGSLASNDDRNGAADRCSKLSFSLFPGQTRFAHLVEFGDNAVVDKYALVVKYEDIVCGDGLKELGEQCDDGNTVSNDGCDATCQIEFFCGDSVMQPAEQCDDGNQVAGDGCDMNCQVENAVTEIEPNEDGSTITGSGINGNDFATANADANGAFTTSTRIVARLRPAGDEDVFAFRNPHPTDFVMVRFDIWNNAPNFGIGVSCGTGIDPYLHIRNAAGTSLVVDDDRVSSDNCPGITFGIAPGETVYAHVLENGDNAEIASYTLDVVYTPLPNGTREIEPNDDGTVNSSASGITGNDFNATAVTNANANGAFTQSTRIIARLTAGTTSISSGDEDVFAFNNPSTSPVLVRFDIWNLELGFGIGVPCGSSIDTGLNIRAATGTTPLASNDDRDSSDACSGLTFQLNAGQTVYAHVVEFGDNLVIPSYLLEATYIPIVCGDGVLVSPSEECDDNNTANGDGCDSTCKLEVVCGNGVLQTGEQCDDANTANDDGCSVTCTIENLVAEVEPNNTTAEAMASSVQISGDTFVSGAIGVAGDVDRFQVTVATATTVRFETFTSSGECSTTALDLRLFDSASNTIVTDGAGSGINECGAIVMFLDAGTYYVQVEERGNTSPVAAYLLQVAYQTNDGTETEPNGTTATASTNLENKNDTFVFGDHMVAGDVDVYAITVPANASIRAELIEGNRQNETCESGNVDASLTLFDDTGAQIADDNDSGRGLCSLIDGTGATPSNATARNPTATAKTYYLMVRASGLATVNGSQFVYRLQVTLR